MKAHDRDSDIGFVGTAGSRPGAAEFFVKRMRVYLDRQLIDFRLTSAVSGNPIIGFPVKVSGPGELRVVFVSSEGRQWEVNGRLWPAG
jgi:hypothetical protein